MNRDKEVIELCRETFFNIGLKRLALKLGDYLSKKDNISELYEEALNLDNFSDDNKRRYFKFINGDYQILKFLIMTYEKGYSEEGKAEIIINKLEDETASFKDNPIKNLHIIYEDEKSRDIDFERLMLLK